jgi:hypothetical protein
VPEVGRGAALFDRINFSRLRRHLNEAEKLRSREANLRAPFQRHHSRQRFSARRRALPDFGNGGGAFVDLVFELGGEGRLLSAHQLRYFCAGCLGLFPGDAADVEDERD